MKYNGYDNLAYYYDRLTDDINYDKISKYIKKSIDKHSKTNVKIACDLACGTGSLIKKLSLFGFDMIGIDISENMLSLAKDKLSHDNSILLLNQDISEFELYGTVDLITCMLDGVNHITNINKVEKLFNNVDNYLNPGGLFIFDVNTKYKFEEIYGENTFFEEYEDFTYLWHNTYNLSKKTCEFYIVFFIKDEKDKYIKKHEINYERYYSDNEIKNLLKNTNLEIVEEVDFFTFSNVLDEDVEKKIFILRKQKP